MKSDVGEATGPVSVCDVSLKERAADDSTGFEVCPEPTVPIVNLICQAIENIQSIREAISSDPTPEDDIYASLKEKAAEGKQRAALRLGKKLAAELPQGAVLACNLVLRSFPESRRAKKMVESLVKDTDDPTQQDYLLDLKRSYFPDTIDGHELLEGTEPAVQTWPEDAV